MALPKSIWNQLKNLTAGDLIKALKADGGKKMSRSGLSARFEKAPAAVL